MTMIDTRAPRAPRPATFAGLTRDLLARARRRHAARQAAHRMRMLDDHLLRDIGIDRADIDVLARQGRT
jgi:uncharacterized protein YjiS (DUF1127 family)